MKKFLIVIVVLAAIAGIGYVCITNVNAQKPRVEEAKRFVKANGYNRDFCIFVDFSKYSGSRRFLLYDLKNNRIIHSCRCAHGNDGRCGPEADINSFSNKVNSHKSSLGKYRIGKKRSINSVDGMFDVSMFGFPCYELHGLESTNSNAHKRGILIHPDYFLSNYTFEPIYPFHSFGCFSIPDESFNIVSKHLKKSDKPVLLWAYYN